MGINISAAKSRPESRKYYSSNRLSDLSADKTLKNFAEQVIDENLTTIPRVFDESRYNLNKRINNHDWQARRQNRSSSHCHYSGAKIVVLGFEGTGSFNARTAHMIQRLSHKLIEDNYDFSNSKFHAGELISNEYKNKTGTELTWSGLASGPLSELVKNNHISNHTQWFSFPSEEFEVLSRLDAYKEFNLENSLSELILSSKGIPETLIYAKACLIDILNQSEDYTEKPKIVIISHSSGGRSAVKFAEEVKNFATIDLFFSIDPVLEAHEVIKQILYKSLNSQLEKSINEFKNWVGFENPPTPQLRVESQWQPEKLYKASNVIRHVNFYQMLDTEGLKINPKFGIQGSPMNGADLNIILDRKDQLGSAGHGEIAYSTSLLKKWTEELENLLEE